jgi:hypothetical protein
MRLGCTALLIIISPYGEQAMGPKIDAVGDIPFFVVLVLYRTL